MSENPLRRGAHVTMHVILHLFVFSTLVVGAVGIHHLIEWLGDPKLFDVVPWRLIADISDTGLIASFLVYGTLSFRLALIGPL